MLSEINSDFFEFWSAPGGKYLIAITCSLNVEKPVT